MFIFFLTFQVIEPYNYENKYEHSSGIQSRGSSDLRSTSTDKQQLNSPTGGSSENSSSSTDQPMSLTVILFFFLFYFIVRFNFNIRSTKNNRNVKLR